MRILNLSLLILLLATGCKGNNKEVSSVKYSDLVKNSKFVDDLRSHFTEENKRLESDVEYKVNLVFMEYLELDRERALRIKGMWPGSIKGFLLKDPRFVDLLDKHSVVKDSIEDYFYINEKFFETLN